MNLHIIILTPLAVLAYFIITDEGIAATFYYLQKLVISNIRGQWWWFITSPTNPVVKYMIWRRSMRSAKKLKKYFDEK